MHSKSEFRNSIVFTISFAAAVALLVVGASRAQNPVPPTACEAAASPAFAAKLHPATRPALDKPQASTRARAGRPFPQQNQVIYENGPANGTADASVRVLLQPLRFVRDGDLLQLRLLQAPIDRG